MDVTVTFTSAEAAAIVDCEALPLNTRRKVLEAAGETFDEHAPKLRCKQCGFARVTKRTAREHLAMHLEHDKGEGDRDITDALIAEAFEEVVPEPAPG